MNLREGILDALVDGGESIVQIFEYMKHLGIPSDRAGILLEINQLLEQGAIRIEYPIDIDKIMIDEGDEVENYWFGLTQKGRSDWSAIKDL